MVAAATTPLPTLSAEDAALFQRFIDSGADLAKLHESLQANPLRAEPPNSPEDSPQSNGSSDSPSHRLTDSPSRSPLPTPNSPLPPSLPSLYAWSTRPEISPWLDFHLAQLHAAIRRRRIAKLEEIADTSKDPIEARRASTTVLRALGLGALRPLNFTPRVSRGVPVRHPSDPRPSGSGHHRTPSAPDSTPDDPTPALEDSGPSSSSPLHPSTHSPLHSSSSALSTQHSAPPSPSFAPLTLPSPPALTARRLAFYAESAGAIPPPNPYCFAAPHTPPTSVISIIMHALMQLDSAGYITLFNLSGIEGRTNENLQAFAKRLPTLYPTKFNRFKVISERQTGDHTYTAEVEVNGLEPQKYRNAYPPHNPPSTLPPTRLTLNLHRPTAEGPLAHCWLWDTS